MEIDTRKKMTRYSLVNLKLTNVVLLDSLQFTSRRKIIPFVLFLLVTLVSVIG